MQTIVELNTAFKNKANELEKKWANTPHKYEGIQQADGYEKGALDMYKAIDSLLIEDLQLHNKLLKEAEKSSNKAEVEQLKSVISYLHVRIFNLQYVKPIS